VLFKGQTTVSDALCRFQNANDAPLPDAQNVTEGRKSCEVPSFPQDTLLVGNTIFPKERPRTETLNSWWCAHRPGARCQPQAPRAAPSANADKPVDIGLTVNNREHNVTVDVRTSLLDLLRERLG
jgi:hypothetical protein